MFEKDCLHTQEYEIGRTENTMHFDARRTEDPASQIIDIRDPGCSQNKYSSSVINPSFVAVNDKPFMM